MEEVEVKILEINREKIVKNLAALGAKRVFEGEIVTLFLDFPDGQIHKRRDVLRLRKEPDKVELTYKKTVQNNAAVKQVWEYSVVVSDLETAQVIFGNLGLHVTQRMEKRRLSYMVGNVRFDIDQYEGEYRFIPEFLEIEGSVADIRKYTDMLGFQWGDCLAWSTDELILHYRSMQV